MCTSRPHRSVHAARSVHENHMKHEASKPLRPHSTADLPIRVAVFSEVERADAAVHALHRAGFDPDQISLICPTCIPGRPTDNPEEHEVDEPAGSHTKSAVAGGSTIGAILGGALAAVTMTATGGMGLLVVGPLVAGAAGGAVTGGLLGAMTTRGFEREIADYYDQSVQKGKILVAVEDETPEHEKRLAEAERIFEEAGADPIALHEG